MVLIVAAAAFFHGPVVTAAEPTTPAGYNGTVDPPVWPPRQAALTREPLPKPPYLVSPAAVIPVDVDRQLLVDARIDAEGPADQAKAIEPFTRANCEPISADKTRVAVKWKDGADLSAIAGKPVGIRFHLRNGELYAFWITPDAGGASNGYMAAGGPGFTGPRDLPR